MNASHHRTTARSRGLAGAAAVLLLMIVAAAVPAGAARAAAPAAFVRVNQVGYPDGASKRAYLMASGSEADAPVLGPGRSSSAARGNMKL